MKAYGGVNVLTHVFLTSALVVGKWSASLPDRFTPGETAPHTYWIVGWVDPRAGLHYMEKWKFLSPPGLELRPLDPPARSQSLYRLRYPGSIIMTVVTFTWMLSMNHNSACFMHAMIWALFILFSLLFIYLVSWIITINVSAEGKSNRCESKYPSKSSQELVMNNEFSRNRTRELEWIRWNRLVQLQQFRLIFGIYSFRNAAEHRLFWQNFSWFSSDGI
jgi:hypothetical protein